MYVNLRERRFTLEIVMPIAALAALVVGAVVASAEPAPTQRVEMEEEEIITEVSVEPEAMVIESPAVAAVAVAAVAPAPVKKQVQPVEELGTSKLDLQVTEGTTVYLGKKKLGVAPFEPIEIVEGRHLIKLELGDSVFTEWLDVPPGATVTYRWSLFDE